MLSILLFVMFWYAGAATDREVTNQAQEANGNTEKKMITMKSYTVVLEDGTTGAMSTVFLDAYAFDWQEDQIRTKRRKRQVS
jgi:hypothetical protein